MEISKCPDSIAIEAFQRGIKRDTSLFIELTKISLDAINEEAQKFVDMEKKLKHQ